MKFNIDKVRKETKQVKGGVEVMLFYPLDDGREVVLAEYMAQHYVDDTANEEARDKQRILMLRQKVEAYNP